MNGDAQTVIFSRDNGTHMKKEIRRHILHQHKIIWM
jgi:hypothetical protein